MEVDADADSLKIHSEEWRFTLKRDLESLKYKLQKESEHAAPEIHSCKRATRQPPPASRVYEKHCILESQPREPMCTMCRSPR